MKIIFTIPELLYSGAPKMLSWVANQMALKGHDITIVSFFSNKIEQSLTDNIKFHTLGIKKSNNRIIRNSIGMMRTISALNRYIKNENPDLVVSFLDSVGYIYLAYNKLFGKQKIVISERVDPYQYKGINSKIRFNCMKYASGSVFQTAEARDFFKNEPKIYNNSTIIPNPVVLKQEVADNLTKYSISFSQRDNRIVTVGRLSIKQKRQDLLIEAFEKVHSIHPELSLYIYGDGESKNELEILIKDKKLENSVILAGKTNQVEESIYNAKAFVLSSDYEGIPNSLIEAMAIGVPSVATDCSPGGAKLLIDDSENAFLVPRNDPDELAKKILILIENEEISNKFSDKSKKIVSKFSESKISEMWELYFSQIINRKA